MKKLLLIAILFCLSYSAFNQKLVEDGVDEFTGAKIKRTSWKTMCESMKFVAYFRISKINDDL